LLRRTGFRRLLPVVQLALYIALIWPDWMHLYRASVPKLTPLVQSVLWQESEEFEFHPIYIDRPTPIRTKLAVLINLPAVLPVGIALSFLLPSGPRAELVLWSAGLPCVVFLWYAVGLWIDRRLGFIPSRARRFSRLRLGMWSALYAMSLILVCLLIGYLGLLLFHARNEFSDVQPRQIALFALLVLPVAWWISFAFLVCRSGLRRVRAASLQNT
jgi:hypothetical protein